MGRSILAGNSTPVAITHIEDGVSIPLGTGGSNVSNSNPLPVEDTWTISKQSFTNNDDSDTTFTVTANEIWQILWIWAELSTTATAGNRQLTVVITDASDDILATVKAGAVQAASLTRNYLFAPGIADLPVFRDTSYLTTPLPPTFILPAGYKIRVYDSAAIAVSADDMIIHMLIAKKVA